jgi:O-methyltransferase domain
MRDVVIVFMETHYAPFGDLLGTIRTGQPAAERFYGQPFFAWLSRRPEQASRFTAAMASLTGGFKGAAITALPLDGTGTIIDVGGRRRHYARVILAAHPHLQGVLFDLPHVIASAPGVVTGYGVGDRVGGR